MRTSAELINDNLDKLSLSDHSARPRITPLKKSKAEGHDGQLSGLVEGVAGPMPSYRRRGHNDSWPEGNLDRAVRGISTPPTNTRMPFTGWSIGGMRNFCTNCWVHDDDDDDDDSLSAQCDMSPSLSAVQNPQLQ